MKEKSEAFDEPQKFKHSPEENSKWAKRFVAVAVPCPLHRVFDYRLVACECVGEVGSRVRVKFGYREVVGVIWGEGSLQEHLSYKDVLEVLDDEPLWTEDERAMLDFIARYYQAPLGLVVEQALPKALRKGKGLPKLKPLPSQAIVAAPSLSVHQQSALDNLTPSGFGVDVIEGVTGSGKSELYAARIVQVVEGGGQVLVLVPEIGLVEALAQHIERRLGGLVVRYHSNLTESQQLQAWTAAYRGVAKVVVGTRSAVFVRFQQLGLIVVDEEHDMSYKQQEGEVRYHARDVALWRAKRFNIPILLGSATPSLETYQQWWQGRYRGHILPERIHAVSLPKVRFTDTAREGVSEPVMQAIQSALARGEQAMLFLNRRGFAPILRCVDCGWQAVCPACDALYAVHTDRLRLHCHHCGRESEVVAHCPSCGGHELQTQGLGTQRLERQLQQRFPKAKILRMDSDTLTTAKRFVEAVASVQAGEVDIILGTQWLSKGHHFPKLSVVGLVDCDGAFYSHDFRALERLGQLLVQVSGRAGREREGEVWIQTRDRNHAVFQVLREPYQHFAKALWQERQQSNLPPCGAQALLSARHKDGQRAFDVLDMTRRGAQSAGVGLDLLWLGPVPALMTRKDGQQRMQLLLQSPKRSALQSALPAIRAWLEAQAKTLSVRVGIDVDPLGFDD
ncbi:MAG: primosomal protein N' [Cardiobacteriaceae bacterium]|nr:primosomal protein N' [Cardiobacteriaceae bacterium]